MTNTSNLTYNYLNLIVVPTNAKMIRVLSILRTYESLLCVRRAGQDKVKCHAQISIEFNQITNFAVRLDITSQTRKPLKFNVIIVLDAIDKKSY